MHARIRACRADGTASGSREMLDERRSPRNPVTQASFRRQVRRQVYLPLLLGTLILVGVILVLWLEGPATARTWADVALVFMVLLVMPGLLLGVLIIGVLAYAAGWLAGWLPGPVGRAQEVALRVTTGARRGADLAATPVVLLRACWSASKAAIDAVKTSFRKG